MNKYLFLDDVRFPEEAGLYMYSPAYTYADWDIVRTYNEFVNSVSNYFKINNKLPFISFDHDIADFIVDSDGTKIEQTGYTCAKWLVDFCMDHEIKYIHYLCHSMNTVGKKNIESLLNQFNNINK